MAKRKSAQSPETLKDKFSEERLRSARNKLLPHYLVPLLEINGVSNFKDLSVEGWFGIVVVIRDERLKDFVRNAIAAGMNVEPETVDFEEVDGLLQASADMSCGSARMPWPEYGIQTLDAVNRALRGSKHVAVICF